jgi:uroporphyrinogen decarboxylase
VATMASRDRVVAALRHEEPDRVPLNMSLTLDAYVRLREHLGMAPDPSAKVDRLSEVRPGMDLVERLGIDVTYVRLRGVPPRQIVEPHAEGNQVDEWGAEHGILQLPGGSHLTEVVRSPLERLAPKDIDLDAYPWPDPDDLARTAGLEDEARRLYEQTELAIMGRFGGPILETAFYLRGYEQWMEDLVAEPEFAIALLERVADVMIRLDAAGIRAAGRYLTILRVSGEDLGMQDRPLFSPTTWRDILRPVLARRWKAARKLLDEVAPRTFLLLHSDGSFREFIPDLIEDGIQVLDPMQVHLPRMDADGLKRDFGARLAFHGAVDTQDLLPFRSPLAVAAETERCIRALAPGGGYILAPVHNVQPDVPPENLIAMVDTLNRVGRYPIVS